jgi:hypothetical protein
MTGIADVLDRINNNTLESPYLLSFIKGLQEDATKGLAYITKDDVQWLQTYAFVLDKIEHFEAGKAFDMRAGDWRQSIDDFSKLKLFIDEMEEKELVNEVSWTTEGIVLFNILNPELFRKYIYNRIRSCLK